MKPHAPPKVPRRARLVVRIYVATLVSLAWLGLLNLTAEFFLKPPWMRFHEGEALYLTRTLAAVRDRPAVLTEQARRIRDEAGLGVSFFRANGTLLVANQHPPRPALDPAVVARLGSEPVMRFGAPPTTAVAFHEGGRVACYALFTPLFAKSPLRQFTISALLALAFGALISLAAARYVTRPLGRLAKTAQLLGAGDLHARVGLDRNDEFGAVARAFDDMAERFELLLRSQQQLMANVSHELRNPLATIRVAVDLASEGDAEVARASLVQITDDLADVERLLDDILATSRFELAASRADPAIPATQLAPVDGRILLTRAAARFRAVHPSRTVELALGDEVLPLLADPTLFRRVIDNLLDNAHKYSEPTKPLVLRARQADDRAVIEVVDQGIGIAADDLPHVFEPFFRADRSRSRVTGGAGLGLALARRIVEAHGGSIAIESIVGVGTTVRLTLPRAVAADLETA